MKNWALPFFEPNRLNSALDIGDVIKFTSDISYSTGNFSILRDKHSQLQLDSVNGTTDRLNTILERTKWPSSFLKDKIILECGCGAGPDTEILLKLGAKVIAVDLAGWQRTAENLKNNDNVQLIQADITNLPLQKKSFDIVWCHRVLQHTPDPEKTLNHILQFVKNDGAVFVHSYARTPRQMLRWKYALLPFTRMMQPEKLYQVINKTAPFLFKLTSWFFKLGRIGTFIATTFIPFCNYKNKTRFKEKSNEFIIEVGVHDTFDALSPPYDKPMAMSKMKKIANKYLSKPFEVVYMFNRTIVLLRTTLPN